MYVRSKVVKGTRYYQVVEGYRDENGKVRHRTVASLGRTADIASVLHIERHSLELLRKGLAESLEGFDEANAMVVTRASVAWYEREVARVERQVERLETAARGFVIDPDDPALDPAEG